MSDGPPSQGLGDKNQPWRKWVEGVIARLDKRIEKMSSDISNTLKGLAGSVGKLADQVKILTASAQVQYAEFTVAITNFTGFYTGTRPTVTVTSPTGRIELSFGGSANGGDVYFVYSITTSTGTVVADRATIQANPAQRVAVSGGSSFAPSGNKIVVVNVPADTALTVTLELYASSTFAYFFGGSIMARATP